MFNCSIDSPSSIDYKHRSDFDFSDPNSPMRKSKAFSFGMSREAYEKVYLPNQKNNKDKSIPGPGTYNLFSTIGTDSRKYSLYGRTSSVGGSYYLENLFNFRNIDPVYLSKKKNVPGPG